MAPSEFMKKNWLGLTGLLVGVIGIVLSVVFYAKSHAVRDPVFLVDRGRTEIVRSDRISDAPIKIVRPNGQEIVGDINSVRLYLWNRGRESIRKANILQPLNLVLDTPSGEILDYKILKTSRPVVAPMLARSKNAPLREIGFSFDILEQDDGVALQLIYIGTITSPIKLKGTIEGVAGPVDDSTLRQVQFWKEYGKKALAFLAFACVIFGINVVPLLLKSAQKVLGERFVRPLLTVGDIMLAVALLVLFAWIAVLSPIREAKQQAGQTVAEAIPTCLR